jgi:hypothetical protein
MTFFEISGSHGSKYVDGCLLGIEYPDVGGSRHLWNVGKLLPDLHDAVTQETVSIMNFFVKY